MEAAFLTAAMPEPFILCGQKLRPFSLGHYWLFRRHGLAFFTDRTPEVWDLVLGIAICSGSFEDGLIYFQNPDSNAEIEAFTEKIIQEVSIEEKISDFSRYLKAALEFPDFYPANDDGETLTAPWIQTVRIALMLKLHLPENVVMNQPLTKTIWDYATIGEMDGVLRFGKKDYLELRKMADQFAKEVRDGA